MFVNKKFVNEGLITKITIILCHENLELYGKCVCYWGEPERAPHWRVERWIFIYYYYYYISAVYTSFRKCKVETLLTRNIVHTDPVG